jgi:DNA-binding Lrp family transcriptional regulator
MTGPGVDQLDIALIAALREHPKSGPLELSRLTKVARATVQARLAKLEASGVITGYGPDIDLAAAGHPVQAFVTLEITQGALDEVGTELAAIPGVLEAYATTGEGDLIARIAASSHGELQNTLLQLNRSTWIARTTSVIVLTVVVAPRALPLLAAGVTASARTRAPEYRMTSG